MGRLPAHELITRELRRRLGSMSEGERFPSEVEVAGEFSVSRMTARAAISALARDGLLDRIPGRGSFVTKTPSSRRVVQLMSFYSQALSDGKRPSSKVISAMRREPTQEERRAFNSQNDVIAIERVRRLNDVPVAIELATFSLDMLGLLELDLEIESAHGYIRKIGYSPVGGSSQLSARNAGDDADYLEVDRDAALVVETRTIHDATGKVIEFTSTSYVPGRYNLSVDFSITAGAE